MKLTILVVAVLLVSCSSPKPEKVSAVALPAETPVKADDAVEIMEQAASDTLKGSLAAKAAGKIGEASFTIRYHSPAVRGRIVWGGLVPFDRVWVTGAHMATSIEFDQNVSIAGTPVPAGKYALFTIPGKDAWTVIINKNWEQHLTDEYNEKDDLVRFTTKPEIEMTNQERLRYVIEAEGVTEGEVVMYWEKVEVSVPVKVGK